MSKRLLMGLRVQFPQFRTRLPKSSGNLKGDPGTAIATSNLYSRSGQSEGCAKGQREAVLFVGKNKTSLHEGADPMAGQSRLPTDFGKKSEGQTSTGTMTGGQTLGQQAQDRSQKAKETASTVADKAKDLASQAGQKTDEAISTVGEKMTSWAGSLRQGAPHEGMIGSAASAVANQLDAGGHYLQEHGVRDMVEDLESVIRRHPIQSLAIGFGVGCLIGLALSRR